MTDFESRIVRLERENRLFKLIGGAALCVTAVLLLTGQSSSRPKILSADTVKARVVEAEGFFVKGGDGKTNGEFALTSSGLNLGLFDEHGIERAGLAVDPGTGRPSIGLYSKGGRARVVIEDRGADVPRISVLNENLSAVWTAPERAEHQERTSRP